MAEYVFDAEPLVAYLYDEPGAEAVGTIINEIIAAEANGWLCQVTATEVMYIIAQIEADDEPVTDAYLAAGYQDVMILADDDMYDIVNAPWSLAAEVKALEGISLGDAHAVALAAEKDATLVIGADEEFDDLAVDVDLSRIRDEGV